jgi:oxygen-independent coproporphyrinogen-3 oxidase
MPCGLYVHVPFCRRRCPYCDFYFEVRAEDARYGQGVVDELHARAHEIEGRTPVTLSFGGGTPSHVEPATLARIIDAARAHGLVHDAEVSMEANPEDVDDARAQAWVAAGISRVSLGIQSFDDDVLRYLGRAHDGARARAAVQSLVNAGLSRVGVDLIIGVPGESDTRLHDDAAHAHDLGVGHVSAYLLTVEEGTPLVQLIAQKKRQAVDDDVQATAYERVQETLQAHGYAQYEISNHAVSGHESAHNRLYWNRAPYLGLGPGAHSMRILDDGRVQRRHTQARLDGWLQDPTQAAHDDEVLEPAHALHEAVAFGLRDLRTGVDVDALARLHHTTVTTSITEALHDAAVRGEVAFADGRARLTTLGARFADRVARAVLAEA